MTLDQQKKKKKKIHPTHKAIVMRLVLYILVTKLCNAKIYIIFFPFSFKKITALLIFGVIIVNSSMVWPEFVLSIRGLKNDILST